MLTSLPSGLSVPNSSSVVSAHSRTTFDRCASSTSLYPTNHCKKLTFDVDFLTQRTLGTKQLLRGISAQQNHVRPVLFVHFAEPSSRRNQQVEYFLGGCLVAFENCVLRFPVPVLHGKSSHAQLRPKISDAGGHSFYMRQVSDRHGVIVGQFLASPHFLGRSAKRERLDVESEDYVRTDAADDFADV